MVRRMIVIRKGLPDGEVVTVKAHASYILIQGQTSLWRARTRVPMGLKASSVRTSVSNLRRALLRRGPTEMRAY